LPTPLTPLIGCHAERAAVHALLAQQKARLVTPIGPGGVGKTPLAIGIAREAAPLFSQASGVLGGGPIAEHHRHRIPRHQMAHQERRN
jgi:predicted ATPase